MIGRDVDRRTFLSAPAAAGGPYPFDTGCAGLPSGFSPQIDAFIRGRMAEYDIAGVAAHIIKDDRIAWSATYGCADLERQIPMSLDGISASCPTKV